MVRSEDPAVDAADRLISAGRQAEDAGNLRQACDLYREAVALAPQHATAHLNLGVGLEAAGDADGALKCYEAVLAIDPGNAYANYNLGKLYFIKRAFPQAERHLRAALERKPEFPEAYVVLSNLHDARGEYAEAVLVLETAVRQRPDYAGAWYNYATTLARLDRLGEAEDAARRAIRFDPGMFAAYTFLGDLLRNDARLEEAVETFNRARTLAGGGLACAQAELHALNYFDGISDEALFQKHREVGRQIEIAHPARFPSFGNSKDPEKRLRIGYVSRDFFRHPVSWFLVPVLERHDRSRFAVHCYATSARSDDVTAQVRSLADRWLDASKMSYSELADSIHRDGIDILVDLLGHAGSSDLAVFAQQPAPVQVTWLGYLNTTGLSRMHYRLCDAVSDPPGIAERLHTEALARLPHSQWCYRPYREMELSKEHATEPPCLRNGFVTFGSFNHRLKLSPPLLALWAQILIRLPDARLVIMGVPSGPAQDRLLAQFTQHGIAAARIRLVAPLPMNDYFPWFDQVDLALDSTPYSGGTTTCDTLWMGVPVVTLAGRRSVSRSAASMLTTLGLADWIAHTPEDYVRLALKFAGDQALLAELRASLRRRMRESPLMDELRFTRDLEALYRTLWRDWCGASGSSAVA
ncbi:MAG TPA: tetratricopeptide repeat protein [Burkholderiales bacterium]|nr:tetratricopeptide repeat protein [Burkholderiales bacterium]